MLCVSSHVAGCWIGFEDSSSEGGFIWTDGSNTDFVAFAPGEPNGGGGESAVAIDLRGHMGAYTGLLRNGEWNGAWSRNRFWAATPCYLYH